MTYKITFEENPTYVHAIVTGINGRKTVERYMADILNECVRRDSYRILVDERLEGPRLDGMEIFSLVTEGSASALGKFEAIAYIDAEMGEMAKFAETVAVNRGLPIAAFDNADDAKDWLIRQMPGSKIQN